MVVDLVSSTTMVVEDEFITVAHRIVWCGVATVDRRGRPRSRILHPYWERTGDGRARLGRHPPLAAEGAPTSSARRTSRAPTGTRPTTWRSPTATPPGRRTATSTRACGSCTPRAPEPLGYDFHQIWPEGPAAPGAALLRLDPWRLHVADAMTVATPRVWRADTAYR